MPLFDYPASPPPQSSDEQTCSQISPGRLPGTINKLRLRDETWPQKLKTGETSNDLTSSEDTLGSDHAGPRFINRPHGQPLTAIIEHRSFKSLRSKCSSLFRQSQLRANGLDGEADCHNGAADTKRTFSRRRIEEFLRQLRLRLEMQEMHLHDGADTPAVRPANDGAIQPVPDPATAAALSPAQRSLLATSGLAMARFASASQSKYIRLPPSLRSKKSGLNTGEDKDASRCLGSLGVTTHKLIKNDVTSPESTSSGITVRDYAGVPIFAPSPTKPAQKVSILETLPSHAASPSKAATSINVGNAGKFDGAAKQDKTSTPDRRQVNRPRPLIVDSKLASIFSAESQVPMPRQRANDTSDKQEVIFARMTSYAELCPHLLDKALGKPGFSFKPSVLQISRFDKQQQPPRPQRDGKSTVGQLVPRKPVASQHGNSSMCAITGPRPSTVHGHQRQKTRC